ncbi:MAG: membrane dipeptidase [Gemmatimonadales bacterium]|nr:MAG: membrane dipeptidase [Gemmatimonadales bacterium]
MARGFALNAPGAYPAGNHPGCSPDGPGGPMRPSVRPMFRSPVALALTALVGGGLLTGCQEADTPQLDELERPDVSQMTEDEIQERARQIHESVITMDTHIDIPFNFATDEVDPGERGRFQNDLPKMREGGLDAGFFIAYHGQGERTPEATEEAWDRVLQKYHGVRRMAYELYPEEIGFAYTADDVERIHGEGRLVALIGMENLWPIGEDLSRIEEVFDLGARYISVTHNGHNQFGDAAVERANLGDDGPEWGGLSPLGEEAIDEMNRLGIMVDLSHLAESTALDAIERSRAPVLGSHSSVRGIVDIPRNISDETLLAVRENGGVIHPTALGSFVRQQPPERGERIAEIREEFGVGSQADLQALSDEDRAAYDEAMAAVEEEFPPVNVADFIDHVDYIVDLIGIDHVGISSDFDGGGGVEGWMDSSETLNVTIELVRRGYSEAEIRQIWGGNLLRVMREVEQVAAEIQAEGGS